MIDRNQGNTSTALRKLVNQGYVMEKKCRLEGYKNRLISYFKAKDGSETT